MANEAISLFKQLNAPFPYSEYQYDSFGDRCYIAGQSITERLNEVLGVGYWKYEGLYETEKILQDPNGKNQRVKIYVRFSFFNTELKEWISFIDVGSEQIKAGMNEGDATKSAITDGMKKCASRIGVANDLYKGKITWDKQRQSINVPDHYQSYYREQGWLDTPDDQVVLPSSTNRSGTNRNKSGLTEKLRTKSSPLFNQIRVAWQQLAGSLDGLEEWYQKKQQEQATDQQILHILQKKIQEKNAFSA